jgi:hypothetical protein
MFPAITCTEFLFHPEMLGQWFSGPTWHNWKIVLKAMFAEEMSPREVYQFYELADRAPPKARVREAWFAIGRRAGKDSIVSGIATYVAAMSDFTPYLRAGEVPLIVCLACDRSQSRIVMGYIRG